MPTPSHTCIPFRHTLQSIAITSLLILLIDIIHPVSLSLSPPPPPSTSPPPPLPSIQGHVPQPGKLLDYVIRPPPPTHRVCTAQSSPVALAGWPLTRMQTCPRILWKACPQTRDHRVPICTPWRGTTRSTPSLGSRWPAGRMRVRW